MHEDEILVSGETFPTNINFNLREMSRNFYSESVLNKILADKYFSQSFSHRASDEGMRKKISKLIIGEFHHSGVISDRIVLKAHLKSKFQYYFEEDNLNFTIPTTDPSFDLALTNFGWKKFLMNIL